MEQWLDESGRPSSLSASRFLLHQKLSDAMRETIHGQVLEAGAGGSPFGRHFRELADQWITLDIQDRYGDIDLLSDVQDMPEVESDSFDVVICTQVLEHLPAPGDALQEIRRVLKNDGILILSAPHLSMIHEAPHDYFRFTRFGLERLCRDDGLVPRRIEATGGIVAFLLHPLRAVLLSLAYPIPGVRNVALAFNELVLVPLTVLVDRYLGLRGVFPLDYVVVAESAPDSS